MAAPGQGSSGESDDWFADVEQQHDALESDPPSAEDDWLVPLQPARRTGPSPEWKRIGVVAGGLVVLVLAGLAAGGVFSSSNAPKTHPLTGISITPPTTTAAKKTAASALPSQTLKPGDTGRQVRALQRALKSLGYPVGKVDGQYGPATKTAVAAFQHTAGLTEDGVFGPKTLNALIQRAGP